MNLSPLGWIIITQHVLKLNVGAVHQLQLVGNGEQLLFLWLMLPRAYLVCAHLSHSSQSTSDANLRLWSYFSKQLVSEDPTTSKSEFPSLDPHGNSVPLRGLKAQNKASLRSVKKTGPFLSTAMEYFSSGDQANPGSGTLQALFP